MENFSTTNEKADIGEIAKILVLIERIDRGTITSIDSLQIYLIFLKNLGRQYPFLLKYLATGEGDIISSSNIISQYTDDTRALERNLDNSRKIFEGLFQENPTLQSLAAYVMGRQYLSRNVSTFSSHDAQKAAFYRKTIFYSITEYQESQWDQYTLPNRKNISEAVRLWDISLSSSKPFRKNYSMAYPEYIELAILKSPRNEINLALLWSFCATCIKMEEFGIPPFLTCTYEGLDRRISFIDFLRSIGRALEKHNIRFYFSGKAINSWIIGLQTKRRMIELNLVNMAIARSEGEDVGVFGSNVHTYIGDILGRAKGVWNPIFESDDRGDPTNPASIDTSDQVFQILQKISKGGNNTHSFDPSDLNPL